jgi:ABC-type uncharacterized transport system substrate-binding protein
MIPPAGNSITAPPINTRLSLVRGKVFKTLILVTFMLVFVHLADAQQPAKVPRIGVLIGASASAMVTSVESFRQGLRELGYVEGKNIEIESRYAEGKRELFPDLAAEIVRLKPDVIVASGTGIIRNAMQATSTIPIVVAGAGDLVETGVVASLARPGGNVTGTTNISPDLSGKRLELLKEVVPKAFTGGRILAYRFGLSGRRRSETDAEFRSA